MFCPHQELTGGLGWPGEPWPDPISFPTLQQLSKPLRVSGAQKAQLGVAPRQD